MSYRGNPPGNPYGSAGDGGRYHRGAYQPDQPAASHQSHGYDVPSLQGAHGFGEHYARDARAPYAPREQYAPHDFPQLYAPRDEEASPAPRPPYEVSSRTREFDGLSVRSPQFDEPPLKIVRDAQYGEVPAQVPHYPARVPPQYAPQQYYPQEFGSPAAQADYRDAQYSARERPLPQVPLHTASTMPPAPSPAFQRLASTVPSESYASTPAFSPSPMHLGVYPHQAASITELDEPLKFSPTGATSVGGATQTSKTASSDTVAPSALAGVRTGSELPNRALGVPSPAPTPGTVMTAVTEPINLAEKLESLKLTSFYVRPGYGSSGRPIVVNSNYFAVRAMDKRGKLIYHYDIDINPVVKQTNQKRPRTLLRAVWEQLALEQTAKPWLDAFGAAAFDGRKNAYTPIKFPVADTESVTLTTSLNPTGEVQNPKKRATTSDEEFSRFRVQIRLVATVDLEAVMEFCRADQHTPHSEEAALTDVMATNVLLRDVPSKKYTQVGATGNKFYTLDGLRPLPQGAVVLNGFMQSFRYSNSGMPLINLDLGFSAFLKDGPALEVMADILGVGPGGRGRAGPPVGLRGGQQQLHELTPLQIATLKKKLRGAKFTVTHRQSSRLHTVISVTSRGAHEINFEIDGKDGGPPRTISVADYYREYYQCPVTKPRLPCIQYGKRAYIPIEFVNIAHFNSLPPTNLSADQTAEMIKTAAMRPELRVQTIMKWRAELAYEKQPKISAWGLQVNTKMVEVKARVLPPPGVQYADKRVLRVNGGSWNLRGTRFARKGNRPLINWAVVSFDRFCDIDDMQRWITYLVNRLKALGVDVQNERPKCIAPSDPRNPTQLIGSLQAAAREAFMVNKQPPQLICVILPGKDAWLYEAIKKITFTELKAPVPTQCMQAQKIKLDRGLDAYTDNLAMKIVSKLGGVSHQIPLSDMPGMVYGKTMLLGADLGQPPFRPGQDPLPTVACSIATYNAECDAYSAQIRLQHGRSEIIHELSSMVEEHLRIFAKHNDGEYPERILVFRDGISEGQYAAALQYEHDSIVQACHRIQPGYRPGILVCVCAKRHNTRFFATSKTDGDRTGNLPPGLVVDRTVTHPYAFDFFLQAHAGLVGTARPTHYICLLDELAMKPDHLQQLVNALCYSFARCTRSVSVVPVCYMADLVCQKARLIVQQNPNSVAPSETSAGRTRASMTESMTQAKFEQLVDVKQVQKLMAKNPELAQVAWWM